ncbi:MAG: response regulator transcription factor [Gammaproteobacteria bacterium]
MQNKPQLLIVEDENAILQGLIDVFVYHGYAVDAATDGDEGLRKALCGNYALILLDVMLPKLDGFTLCNKIRTQDLEQPVIMLTAKSSEEDIITGLTLGADDYIAKPFSVRELVLRVEAVLKRSRKLPRECRMIEIGPHLTIDSVNLVQLGHAAPLRFTRREIDILQYLKANPERPVCREELLENVWGYKQADAIETRTVDIHIAKLRRKIEPDPKQPRYLLTLRGEGYRLLPFNKEP